MTPDDFGWMAAFVTSALTYAAIFGRRGGDSSADTALLGGSALATGLFSVLMFAA